MRMNLRQIIRNQKLQKFDLISLVSEAPKDGSGTYQDFLDTIPPITRKGKPGTNQGSTQVSVRTALAYKSKGFKDSQGQSSQSQIDAYNEALAQLVNGVESDQISRKDIPKEIAKNLPSKTRQQPEKPQKVAEPQQSADTDTSDEKDTKPAATVPEKDFDDELDDFIGDKGDEEFSKKDDADDAEEELENFPPPQYPTARPDPETETKAEEILEGLRNDGFFSGSGALSDEGSETSDGATKQIALMLGYPAGGAAKPYILGNEDELTKEQEESGVQALGLEPGNSEQQEWRAAPGNAGSMLNEIVSCEGANILAKNPDLSPEELAILMYKQFGETACAEQNKGPNTAAGFSKKIVPEGYNPSLYTKMLASAYAAKSKNALTDLALDVNSDENGFDRESAKISQFYGATQSLDDQVEMAQNAKGRIFSPGGDEITDRDELIELIKAGGGGDNPSDTATFIEDKNGNLIVAFHSDKMSTSDIQANSTIFQEIEEMKNVVENEESIPQDKKDEIYDRLDEMRKQVETAESNLPKVLVEPAGVLADYIEGDIKLQAEMLTRMRKEKDIKNKVNPMLQKFKKAASGKYVPPPGTKEKINKHLTTDNPNDEEVIVAFMKYAADEEPPKLTEEQQKIIARTSKLYDKEIDNPALKIDRRLDTIRKDTIRAEQDTRRDLNEMGSVKISGKDVLYGDYLEAKNIDKKLHLSAMNQGRDEPPEAHGIMKYADAFKLNMAGVIVGPEQLRECMNVEDTDDLISNFEVDDIDPDDDSSKNLIFDKSVKPPQVTGRKAAVYAVTKDGKRIPIAEKSLRSKSGQLGRLQSTYTWSKEIQECFKGGDKKTNESLNALLGSILAEEKINTLAHHWKIAEDDYPVDLFIKELNERSLN